jgi:hypothetical protein
MFVDESFAYQSSGTTYEDYLVAAKPYGSGYVSFFPGIGPNDFKATMMAEAVRLDNTRR